MIEDDDRDERERLHPRETPVAVGLPQLRAERAGAFEAEQGTRLAGRDAEALPGVGLEASVAEGEVAALAGDRGEEHAGLRPEALLEGDGTAEAGIESEGIRLFEPGDELAQEGRELRRGRGLFGCIGHRVHQAHRWRVAWHRRRARPSHERTPAPRSPRRPALGGRRIARFAQHGAGTRQGRLGAVGIRPRGRLALVQDHIRRERQGREHLGHHGLHAGPGREQLAGFASCELPRLDTICPAPRACSAPGPSCAARRVRRLRPSLPRGAPASREPRSTARTSRSSVCTGERRAKATQRDSSAGSATRQSSRAFDHEISPAMKAASTCGSRAERRIDVGEIVDRACREPRALAGPVGEAGEAERLPGVGRNEAPRDAREDAAQRRLRADAGRELQVCLASRARREKQPHAGGPRRGPGRWGPHWELPHAGPHSGQEGPSRSPPSSGTGGVGSTTG